MKSYFEKIQRGAKKSVVIKMTIMTSVVLIVTIGLLFVGQVLFLEKFFVSYKVNQIKNEMVKLKDSYPKMKEEDQIVTALNNFSSRNGLQAAVLDDLGNVKYQADYYLTLETKAYGLIKVPLSNIVYEEGFKQLSLKEGDSLILSTLFDKNQKIVYSIFDVQNGTQRWSNVSTDNVVMTQVAAIPVSVTSEDTKSLSATVLEVTKGSTAALNLATAPVSESGRAYSVDTALETMNLYGKITELKLPFAYNQITPYDSTYLYSAINRWNLLRASDPQKPPTDETAKIENNLFEYAYNNPMTGLSSRILVLSYFNGEAKEYLFVNLALRPIGDAVQAVKLYYLIGFGIALLPMLFLAFVFSKMITRPLVALNETAGRFESMDFSANCDVNSEDELGLLATRLNQMAQNLDKNMEELKKANAQLLLDIEKEKSLEKMRKDFIASVSHEFKTPLGIVRAYTEGLENSIEETKRRQYMAVISKEVEKMDELVLDLLELSKLESGTYTLNKEPLALSELVDQVRHRFLHQAEALGVSLKAKVSDAPVLADYRMIERALTNFVNNAVRYVNPSGEIYIWTEEKEKTIRLYVRNSGSTIEKEQQEFIWDRFYRIDSARNKRIGGTGLGLSIVKNIIELHQMPYGLISESDSVSFYFELPRA